MSLTTVRWILLALSGFALLTGFAMHGLVRRLLLQPIVNTTQLSSGISSLPFKAFRLMIARAWVFRIYHLCFAVLLFAGWWYFGTDAGRLTWMQWTVHPQ
jgi:hypothetical protein